MGCESPCAFQVNGRLAFQFSSIALTVLLGGTEGGNHAAYAQHPYMVYPKLVVEEKIRIWQVVEGVKAAMAFTTVILSRPGVCGVRRGGENGNLPVIGVQAYRPNWGIYSAYVPGHTARVIPSGPVSCEGELLVCVHAFFAYRLEHRFIQWGGTCVALLLSLHEK